MWGLGIGTTISVILFIFTIKSMVHGEMRRITEGGEIKKGNFIEVILNQFFENFNFNNNLLDKFFLDSQVDRLTENYLQIRDMKDVLKSKEKDMKEKLEQIKKHK